MPEFSTNELVSLEKQVNLRSKLLETDTSNLDDVYEINRCAEWIRSNGFQKVCLQFPDNLLSDSSNVALKLQSILNNQTVYILGDTAYESCCIDYVAAAHIQADAIIHFGPICFSKTSGAIPYLNIFEKHPINIPDLLQCYRKEFSNNTKPVLVIVDSPYVYKSRDIEDILQEFHNVTIISVTNTDNVSGDNEIVLFVGDNERKLLNIDLANKSKLLYYFNPNSVPGEIIKYNTDTKILKRRYYLIEKIKDSNIIGIVIGTLGVKNYLNIIERIKKLVSLNGKKYYLISVGKPTVAKLANFPEIDIYAMITCSMNEIYDSRDFYKPVVTPYDVEVALNPSSLTNVDSFSYDYNAVLNQADNLDNLVINKQTDVSLLTGQIRSNAPVEETVKESSTEIVERGKGELVLNSHFGAGYLQQRTWKGLEQNLGKSEASTVEEGRFGTASGYKNETM